MYANVTCTNSPFPHKKACSLTTTVCCGTHAAALIHCISKDKLKKITQCDN